jgi:peptide/nickel transport system ATP-binding protein
MSECLLEIRDLKTYFRSDEGIVKAVDGVSLNVAEGATRGLVGESGCGKSVTALSVMRLIDPRQGFIAGGEILWKGRNLLTLSEKEMREIRGNDIAMVFQDPFASLNPVFTIGNQISEAIRLHQGGGRAQALTEAQRVLERVHMPSPSQRLQEYPHQISGGMQQRVMIAIALSCNPGLLIADEPTTALDVTIQAQILDLLKDIQADYGMALLLISHDLAVISEVADNVSVMYAGKVVEDGPTPDILSSPRHPYTRALLRSLPRLGAARHKLMVIEGNVPNPLEYPSGCRFHPRCEMVEAVCRVREPLLREIAPGHETACHYAERMNR